MSLDMHTIVFGYVLTDIVCFLVILALWYQNHKHFEGTGFWVLGFAFKTIAIYLIFLRGSIPDWMSVVVANTLFFTGVVLLYKGLEHFLGTKSSSIHNCILLIVFSCIHAYFALVQPDLRIRTLNFSIFFLIFCIQYVWLLCYRVGHGMRRLAAGICMIFLGYCLVNIVRIAEFFWGSTGKEDYFQSDIFEISIFIIYQMLFIFLTYSLTLMVNKRLLVEVSVQKEKFSKAFRSSPHAIALSRLVDGKIIEVNEGFLNITGYSLAEVIGKTSIDLNLWEREKDRRDVVNQLSESGNVNEKEFQFRKKGGDLLTGLFAADIILIDNEKYILSSISDITERKKGETQLQTLIGELKIALSKVKTLSGLLPICSFCKQIRDDQGYWNQIEAYIKDHSNADFSHSICPDCAGKYYPDMKLYEDYK